MKKTLLLSAAVLTGACVSFAQEAQTKTPAIIEDGGAMSAISPSGNWMVSNDPYAGLMTIYNNETGQSFQMNPEEGKYEIGFGNCVSDNGIVLGSTTIEGNDASYWENGEWHALPINEDTDLGYNSAHGITADGSRICGNIGRVADIYADNVSSVMLQPVVWNRNANGQYDMYVELPFPAKDFSNQTPQYVTAMGISDDGKTVVGQVQDAQGFVCYPIIYTLTGEGWLYYFPLPDYDNVELPAPPTGEVQYPNIEDYSTPAEREAYDAAMEAYENYMATSPEMQNYMSDEGYAAYQAAFDAFWEDPENPDAVYPQMEDFMTQEEIDAYNAAVVEFEANKPPYPTMFDFMTEAEVNAYHEAEDAYNAWSDLYYAWLDSYKEAISTIPNFMFNQAWISNNGRYALMTRADESDWPSKYIPFLFDLQEKSYTEFTNYDDMITEQVFDNGSILAASPCKESVRNAFICADPASEQFVAIEDYISEKNPSLGAWVDENMCHTYTSYEMDWETWEPIEVLHENEMMTGTPHATKDLSAFVTFTVAQWQEPGYDYISYYLPMDYVAGNVAIEATKTVVVSTQMGGIINIAGKAQSVTVYDLNGRAVYTNDAPEATIRTGLQHGVYVVKTTDANSAVIINKAAF